MPLVTTRQRYYLFVTNKDLFLKSFIPIIILLGGIDRRRWSGWAGWPGWYCNVIMLLQLTEEADKQDHAKSSSHLIISESYL